MRALPWFAGLMFVFFAAPASLADPFSDHWHDGRAELDGYQWTGTRYGEERTGHAVMIFVTEPFSQSRLVKVDDPAKNPADTFDALKLNLVRDFQTGIYDYNTMVSVFSRSDTFAPAKITFSSAEWCGHVYQELRFAQDKVSDRYYSYFEGETAAQDLSRPREGVSEDNLFILLRGLRGDYLPPGGKRTVPYLPGMFFSRLAHRSLHWSSAEIHRRDSAESITVPAGTFEVVVYEVSAEGREGLFFIETAYPHRIVRWSWTGGTRMGGGETGELTGSIRLAYWQHNGNGEERYLQDLGLETP